MTAPEHAYSLRTLAFGEPGSEAWGAAWFPPPGDRGLLLVTGAGAAGTGVQAELAVSADGGWRLRSPAGELAVAPAGEPLELADAGGFEQLCAVAGRLTLAGETVSFDTSGRRGGRAGTEALDGLDSVREVSAWFEPAEAVALLALRPRRTKGHDQDAITAAVIDPEGWPPVTDPRLSTTYTAAGDPAHVGLELWSDDPESFPRRLAGESTGSRAAASAGGWSVSAERLLCHSRGNEGMGVYLIARPA